MSPDGILVAVGLTLAVTTRIAATLEPRLGGRTQAIVGGAGGIAFFLWAIVLFVLTVRLLDSWFPWPHQRDRADLLIVPTFFLLWVGSNRVIIGRWWP